jgi:hypothetical protein
MPLKTRVMALSVWAVLISLVILATALATGTIHLPRTDSDRMSDQFTLCAQAGVSMSQCPLENLK